MYSQQEIITINYLIKSLKYRLLEATKIQLVNETEKCFIHNGITYSIDYIVQSLEWALEVFNNVGKRKTDVTFKDRQLIDLIGGDLVSLAFIQYSKFDQDKYDLIITDILSFKNGML